MQVSATRTISALTARALFLGGLFLLVVVLQIALVTGLRGLGVNGGRSLLISGAAILALMLAASFLARALTRRAFAREERQRVALNLPDGACCVVWRPQGGEAAFPWELEGDVRAAYPPLARRLGVEGFALIDFEVGADGQAKNLHCVDVWPARVFYDAAAEALRAARFRVRPGTAPRFGPSYRIPFVFRIKGAARVRDSGRLATGPLFYAAKRGAVAALRGLGQAGLFVWAVLLVIGAEARAFSRWLTEMLASLFEKLAARLRNLKRV